MKWKFFSRGFFGVLLAVLPLFLPAHAQKTVESHALPAGLPVLEEAALVRAAGLPVLRRYDLDDGHGVKFRKDSAPDLGIEFRAGKVNVVWAEFPDLPASKAAINADNRKRAQAILARALGADLAARAMELSTRGKVAILRTAKHEIRVMAVFSGMHLITIAKR